MWLRDFLSKDMPCCRTMTYGYNSKLSSRGIGMMMDYGRGLMEELKKIRNTEEVGARNVLLPEARKLTTALLASSENGLSSSSRTALAALYLLM